MVIGSLTQRLPEPRVRRVPAPQLTPDQQRRKAEVEQLILSRYAGYRIVDTTQTYIGDIVDWVDPATVPGSTVTAPPPPSREVPPNVKLGRTELEEHPELRGPANTIPFSRPDFGRYVRGETPARTLKEFIQEQAAGQFSGFSRLYGGYGYVQHHRQATGWPNNFAMPQPIENGTFSLLEMASTCQGPMPATTREMVGAALSRDRANFGDDVLRLRVEFYTAGYAFGDNVGGWDGMVTGFVPYAGRPYAPGAAITPVSVVGGPQYISRLDILVADNKWWVGHNGYWMGHYPGGLFDLLSPTFGACSMSWYGEVYDPTPATPNWTFTNMGSGSFAETGFGSAAYWLNPFYVNLSGSALYPPPASMSTPFPSDANCYTTSPIYTNGGPGWDLWYYLGGPGGDSAGCD